MFLIGDCQVMNAEEKEYDGRKYFKIQALAEDKVAYCLSCRYEDQPKIGDKFQMFVAPDRFYKPIIRIQKVK